jgi:hypothetical protein
MDHLAFVSGLPALPSQQLVLAVLAVVLLIGVVLLWFLQECLLDLPAEDRQAPPWSVWLMMVPMINVVAAWLLLPVLIPGSFARFFRRQGLQAFGDCGQRLGLVMMILITVGSLLAEAGITAGIVPGLLGFALLLRYVWLLMGMRRVVRRVRRQLP